MKRKRPQPAANGSRSSGALLDRTRFLGEISGAKAVRMDDGSVALDRDALAFQLAGVSTSPRATASHSARPHPIPSGARSDDAHISTAREMSTSVPVRPPSTNHATFGDAGRDSSLFGGALFFEVGSTEARPATAAAPSSSLERAGSNTLDTGESGEVAAGRPRLIRFDLAGEGAASAGGAAAASERPALSAGVASASLNWDGSMKRRRQLKLNAREEEYLSERRAAGASFDFAAAFRPPTASMEPRRPRAPSPLLPAAALGGWGGGSNRSSAHGGVGEGAGV